MLVIALLQNFLFHPVLDDNILVSGLLVYCAPPPQKKYSTFVILVFLLLLRMAGARYTKRIASLELRYKEHNNDP